MTLFRWSGPRNTDYLCHEGCSLIFKPLRLQRYNKKMIYARERAKKSPFLYSVGPKITNIIKILFYLFEETFQQESQEIREGIELAVPTDVLVSQLNSIFHIRIGIPFNKIIEGSGRAIFGFHLYRN